MSTQVKVNISGPFPICVKCGKGQMLPFIHNEIITLRDHRFIRKEVAPRIFYRCVQCTYRFEGTDR